MADDAFSVDWMQGWSDLQRKIWNEWVTMVGEKVPGAPGMENPMQWFQKAMGGEPSAWHGHRTGMGQMPWSMPWAQPPSFGSGMPSAMDGWMRNFGLHYQEASPEAFVVHNMASATESFMRVSKGIFQALQTMGEGVRDGEAWTTLLEHSVEQAKALFQGQTMAGGTPAMDAMAAWSQPLQAWMEMLTQNPMLSNPLMKAFLSGSSGAPGAASYPGAQHWENWLVQMLGVPGLGITRERQERIQAAVREGMAYQKALQEFQELSRQVNLDALDLLHKKLLERGAANEPLETLRDLYVLWVDCSEEANASFVKGQTYQGASARMTNALMRLQNHVQAMTDELLTAFNVPTRKEVNSTHRQVHLLKRRIQTLENELKVLRSRDLSAELDTLRDDMERLDVRELRQDLAKMRQMLEVPLAARAKQEKKVGVKPRAAVRDKEADATFGGAVDGADGQQASGGVGATGAAATKKNATATSANKGE